MKHGLIIRLLLVVGALSVCSTSLPAQNMPFTIGSGDTVGMPLGQDTRVPNTLLLGMTTAVSYDTNALNSAKAVANTQYTLYPEIGLGLTRARWDTLMTYQPGISYSTANIPSYNVLSQLLGIAFDYRATKKLTLTVRNSFLSSSNPFDSLNGTAQLPQFGTLHTPTALNWDYLPKTNEQAGIDAVYNRSAKTSFHIGGYYNYLTYQSGANGTVPNGLFDNSTSALYTLGLFHESSKRYSSGVQYTGQQLDGGHGITTTSAQTVAYVAQFSPLPSLQLSGTLGPQYADSRIRAGTANAASFGIGSGWSWMGGGTASWNHQNTGISVTAIRQLSTGNQYQGNVRQESVNFQVQHQYGKQFNVNAFVGYNINQPLFVTQSSSRLSNNYVSTGAGVSRQLTSNMALSGTYWYLTQQKAAGPSYLYSGNHNRVEISLSYVLAKPIRR